MESRRAGDGRRRYGREGQCRGEPGKREKLHGSPALDKVQSYYRMVCHRSDRTCRLSGWKAVILGVDDRQAAAAFKASGVPDASDQVAKRQFWLQSLQLQTRRRGIISPLPFRHPLPKPIPARPCDGPFFWKSGAEKGAVSRAFQSRFRWLTCFSTSRWRSTTPHGHARGRPRPPLPRCDRQWRRRSWTAA